MTDAIIISAIFLGMVSVVAIPVAVLLGLPTAAWLGRGWLSLEGRELDLRRLEVAARIRESHFDRLPAYVDADDPEALLAWARTDRELAALEVSSSRAVAAARPLPSPTR